MKKNYLLTVPLLAMSIASHAGNWVNTYYIEVYGDNNNILNSAFSVVNGYNNTVMDGYGGESFSSEASNVTGSGNAIVSGAYNSAFGNGNSVGGGPWHESTHVFGNNNSSYTANSNIFGSGNNNVVNGSNAVIGNNNSAAGDSIAIGNNNNSAGIVIANGGTASNGGIAIGNGSNASRSDEVNFGLSNITGIKDGVADTDGVSLSQLNQNAEATLEKANTNTDNTLNSAKDSANQYTDQKIFEFLNDSSIDFSKDNAYALARLGHLNNKLEKIHKQVNAGVASAIATSSVPHKLFKRFSYGMGVGSYKNEVGYSIGVKWGVSKNMALATAVSFNTQNDSSLSLSLAYGF